MITSQYQYRGILKQIKKLPSLEKIEKCASIVFSAEDLHKWALTDDPGEIEWHGVSVNKRIEHEESWKYLRFTGDFTNITRMDVLRSRGLPSFWAPLTTRTGSVSHFPIQQSKYPIVEMTYKVQRGKSIPAWCWHYTTGQFFEFLSPEVDWVTVARAWGYNGFPRRMENFAIRLYSPTRTKETMFIYQVRFREATEEERAILSELYVSDILKEKPRHYPILDEFFPVGVYVNGTTMKTMSRLLNIDLASYLELMFEDISTHNHNLAFVENFYEFLPGDQDALFEVSKNYGIRLLLSLEEEEVKPLYSADRYFTSTKEQIIKRGSREDSVIGWVIKENPSDEEFDCYVQVKKKIEQINDTKPVVYLTREANAFPLYAPISVVSGLSHWKTKLPWELAHVLQTHLKFVHGQQLWAVGPTFIYSSGAPQWNTAPEVRLMINLAFSNGARGWLSYTYHNIPLWLNGECQRSLTGPFLMFSDIWQELGSRLGRFYALAPLLTHAKPVQAPDFVKDFKTRRHPRSRCPEHVDTVSTSWFKGDNYWLFYIVNQDTTEVTGIDVAFKPSVFEKYCVFDATQFVRTFQWEKLPENFHREMFPGQGQIILIAPPHVCEIWSELILKLMMDYYENLVKVEIDTLHTYQHDLTQYLDQVKELRNKHDVETLKKIVSIKNRIRDLGYAHPEFSTVRGKIVQLGSILCACDGVLCRLLVERKLSEVETYKEDVIRFAVEFTAYRLALRKGKGKFILPQVEETLQKALQLLTEMKKHLN